MLYEVITYISQPSLSLTIKKLENEIGLQIFDRCTTPIQLTEAGKTYMEGVRQILAVKANLDTFVDEYNDLKCGLLTLGAPHRITSYNVCYTKLLRSHSSWPFSFKSNPKLIA